MNVLFISISAIKSVNDHSISLDLLREFTRNGHNVYIVCSQEKQKDSYTNMVVESDVHLLKVNIGKNKKANFIEKGLTTIFLPKLYKAAIKKFLSNVHFDLILYPTPPITHLDTVRYIKKRDGAKSYLMLRDIFPQNAVDLGIIKKSGIKKILYAYFRNKEKHLYRISDYIGCMSQANIDYLLKNNPEIDSSKVGLCPNCIEVKKVNLTSSECINIRKKYNLPLDKYIFVYGGNLGKPQGIPFLIECIKSQSNNKDVFFLIVGDGTEYINIEKFVNSSLLDNVRLLRKLPKDEYDEVIAACDVGMIFLDARFTIPNFPSRLLGYMQAGLPVLACTDINTDIGKVIVNGKFGWWCESNNVTDFSRLINEYSSSKYLSYKKNSFDYLNENYNSKVAYDNIMNQVKE